MTRRLWFVLASGIVTVSLAGAVARVLPERAIQPVVPADLVLTNGKVVTLEAPAEAEAIASRGTRIAALGPAAEI